MKILRVSLMVVVTGALLGGCARGPMPSGADATSAEGSAPTTTEESAGTAHEHASGTRHGKASGSGSGTSPGAMSRTGRADPTTGDEEATGSAPETREEDPSQDAGGTSGIETPVGPEPSATSLSEPLATARSTPLVTAPLPPAASARGRLVPRFPAFLRPTRATTVGSSSLSPSGQRLQVALVGATSSSPEAVLRAYRVRLARRGLTEQPPPATAGGSQAAAFSRGLSAVTVTVTEAGPGTSYTVHAVLHTGGE